MQTGALAATLDALSGAFEATDSEQRVRLDGVSWTTYLAIRELLAERPGVRLAYCRGALELMVTSLRHEREKTLLARLFETWAFTTGLAINGYGQATFLRELEEVGLEPDECYVRGDQVLEEAEGARPELAVEICVSRPLVDKLTIYAGLGVPELWIYEGGALRAYALRDGAGGGRYVAITRSRLAPGFDLALAAGYVQRRDQDAAIREFLVAAGAA